MGYVLDHLVNRFEQKGGEDVERIQKVLPSLKGAVQFTLENLADHQNVDFWSSISLAELYVATADEVQIVTQAYKKTISQTRKTVFFLQAARTQLDMLESLDFRPEFVSAGKMIIGEELSTIFREDVDDYLRNVSPKERKVFFFIGQPIDKPDQPIPVFPSEMETVAREYINLVLDQYNAEKDDKAICAGITPGSDILFCEAVIERSMQLDILLPYEEERYVTSQVAWAGDPWVERYFKILRHPLVNISKQDDFLGPSRLRDDPIRRNARWGVYTALGKADEGLYNLKNIVLWDRRSIDGTYGAIIKEMLDSLRQYEAMIDIIDLTKIDNLRKPKDMKKPKDE